MEMSQLKKGKLLFTDGVFLGTVFSMLFSCTEISFAISTYSLNFTFCLLLITLLYQITCTLYDTFILPKANSFVNS